MYFDTPDFRLIRQSLLKPAYKEKLRLRSYSIHSDGELIITGGTIDIQSGYEGLEGLDILICGGDISFVSDDDGLNAVGGSDSSSDFEMPGGFEAADDNIWIRIMGGMGGQNPQDMNGQTPPDKK